MGCLSVAAKDGRRVATHGFFYGYSPVVWAVVGIQACGGLLISLVVRYGDALFKGFATGLALILTTAVSWQYFDFQVTPLYLAGASTTFFAVLLYSGLLPKLARKLAAAAEKVSPRRALAAFPPAKRLDTAQAAACCGDEAFATTDDEASSDASDDAAQLWSKPTGYPWSRVAFGGAQTLLFLMQHAHGGGGLAPHVALGVAAPPPAKR